MTYDEYGILNVTAAELSEFAYRKYGEKSRLFLDSIIPAGVPENALPGAPEELRYAYSFGDIDYVITCEGPAAENAGGTVRLSYARNAGSGKQRRKFYDIKYLAEVYISSYGYMINQGIDSADVVMYYSENGSLTDGFRFSLDADSAESQLETLLKRAARQHRRFIDMCSVMPGEIRNLNFPHTSAREGQKDFIQKAYSSIKKGSDLLVSAPTGTGKTISALFPALRSIESFGIEKVFYFTHTNVSKQAVIKAFESVTRNTKSIKCAVIDAKTSICPKKAASVNAEDSACSQCEKVGKGSERNSAVLSYPERENNAVDAVLDLDTNIYSFSCIRETAEKHDVCPYELLLDISETCQLIVCDYNYLTDPRIRFRRYFGKDPGRYVFLIDEVHNLPERIRNTYTNGISSSFPQRCRSVYAKAEIADPAIDELLLKYGQFMKKLAKACTENEMQITENGEEISTGCYSSRRIPKAMTEILSSLQLRMRDAAFSSADPAVTEVWKTAADFVFSAVNADERFRFFAYRKGDRVYSKIICLDPSEIIKEINRLSVSSVMFSASLTPLEYFMRLLGIEYSGTLILDSPFDPSNLSVLAYTGMNTRYEDREKNARECAEIIYDTVSARRGKYIIYFPSYEYMGIVSKAFAARHRDCPVLIQKENMTPEEKEKFLKVFRGDKYESVTGFCVLGGMYSESIDLVGDSLIGTVIFGTGMPVPTSERNLMQEYYDNLYDEGRNYAYICPGINKVIQAGGRVIRSETDRGVVVLVDDRYRDPNLTSLLGNTWKDIPKVSSRASLSRKLGEFWRGSGKEN